MGFLNFTLESLVLVLATIGLLASELNAVVLQYSMYKENLKSVETPRDQVQTHSQSNAYSRSFFSPNIAAIVFSAL